MGTCCCKTTPITTPLTLVPLPSHIRLLHGNGPVVCDSATITCDTPLATFASHQVSDALGKLDLCKCGKCTTEIRFELSAKDRGAEGYILETSVGEVVITASTAAGFFYGAQTLIQMFPASAVDVKDAMIQLPVLSISDAPRFTWRALMVDCCRHFWTMDEMKKILDYMASMKLNILHWHLTEDQAWRIEIKKYPILTEKGAWRNGVGFDLPADSTTAYRPSDGMYGGFYSQDDCRELVAYAALRGIAVMPEIEIPGHSCALLNAYPAFGCTGEPVEVPLTAGIFPEIACAGNEDAMKFFEDVLTEVAEIFPFEFVHIGGDEAPKENWKKCPKCQARMKEVGAKDEEQLQNWVTKRMEDHLRKVGKRLIGWDEILEGDNISSTAGVMVWRSWKNPRPELAALANGHDMIMSPTSNCYFDYKQSESGDEPHAIKSTHFNTLERVYAFEPVNELIPDDKIPFVKGGQANIWTEFIPNAAHLEYMLAPRLSAMAEVLWSPKELRNFDCFRTRMAGQVQRLEAAGFNYRKLD